jgi:hypothetical protein
MRKETQSMVLVDTDPARLLKKMERYKAPVFDKAAWAIKLTELEG